MSDILSFLERPQLFTACAIGGIPVYWMLGSIFYNDMDDFLDALRLFFQPDWLSALRGEWGDDQWQSLKLTIFIAICIGAAALIYKGARLVF
ncbi:MAG: uncharacterized protein H6R19_2374 [Proteobacteria bacterium]|nr:uncharacterized protein [Pseudomonadota bacterium]